MLIVSGIGVLLLGAVASLALGRSALANRVGPLVGVVGAALCLVPAIQVLLDGQPRAFELAWSLPLASLRLGLDALSAFFVLVIGLVSGLAAIYGGSYLRAWSKTKNLGLAWALYNLLLASMLVVVLARNGMLFLLAWEVMALASFFLVIFEHEKEDVRSAGWTYLVASHIGTAFLLVMFSVLGWALGGLDFDHTTLLATTPAVAGAIFILAVIGFGTKAGFMPLHVWLPEAHPAAPSHVSAVMSGVMIKTGIYGLMRVLTLLGPPPAWWGWLVLAIGVTSGVLGVLLALAQHDYKRLLAYHSVENIGIIAIGLGLGLLGLAYDAGILAVAGFIGAVLHVLNHALFKSLLFLDAGAVLHATHTRMMDELGGLLRHMPVTGLTFLIGAMAICGLPPLNGFVSELQMYLGSFTTLTAAQASIPTAAASVIAIAALALIGGLAVACFTKVFGVVFLGEARSEHARHAVEADLPMRAVQVTLALLCVAIGLGGPAAVGLAVPVARQLGGGLIFHGAVSEFQSASSSALAIVAIVAAGIVALAALLWSLRSGLLGPAKVASSVTWDCGYAAPTARMQYTSSSFAQPITRLWRSMIGTQRRFAPPTGLFPADTTFASETPDLYRERLYRPLFTAVGDLLGRLRWIQHGRLNLYVLYIVLALVALVAWKLS